LEFNNKIPIKKSWGQNFLTDKNTINKIIEIINPNTDDNILEIGPGKGALTIPLSKLVSKINAIEIDPLLFEFLENKKITNLSLINDDILNIDLYKYKKSTKVIGNLPYYITSPIIFKTLENKHLKKLIFMVQKEVAERISSKPKSKNYSRISVMIQTFCNIELKYNISKNVFYPKPKVDSCIIKLNKKETNFDLREYSNFIKAAFRQKRKKIKNNLNGIINEEGLKILGNRRPQDIYIEEYINIFQNYML